MIEKIGCANIWVVKWVSNQKKNKKQMHTNDGGGGVAGMVKGDLPYFMFLEEGFYSCSKA